MALFNFVRKPTKKRTNIDRITAEDLLDQGYSCQEVSEQLGCTKEEIYSIKQARQRREARQGIKNNSQVSDIDNPVATAKANLEAEKINFAVEKLNFEREKLKQRMEEELGTDDEEDAEDIQDAMQSDNPLEAMAIAFLSKQLAGQQGGVPLPPTPPHQNPVYPTTPQTQIQGQQQLLQQQEVKLTDEQINEFIQQHKGLAKQFQKLPDNELMEHINNYFPQLSGDTKLRALELLKKTKL